MRRHLFFGVTLSHGLISSISARSTTCPNAARFIVPSYTMASVPTVPLPPLTAQEERRYARIPARMKQFHDMFQHEYEKSYEWADGSYEEDMDLPSYLDFVSTFTGHLQMHHDIEERHVFPILAKRMPEFRDSADHKEKHKMIHDGLKRVNKLLAKYGDEPESFDGKALRAALDSFRKPLYEHLAEEVESLGVENMRKYWKPSELGLIPM